MGQRLDNLQALRGVACLLVVLYHTADVESRFHLAFSPLKPVMWFGYAGVDLFFVVSGFIIASISKADLGRPSRLPRYAFRRAWRIYPTYWAALALAVVLYACSGPQPVFRPGQSAEWFDKLLLLPEPNGCRFLPVAWTLNYELTFYLAFGVLFLLPRRVALPALVGWAVLVAGAALAGHRPLNRFALLWASPLVLEFLAGVAVAWCPVRLNGPRAAALVAVALVWCGVGSAIAFRPDPAWLACTVQTRVLVFGPPAALVVLALTSWERGGGRVGWWWLQRVGDASYSIYLTHGVAIQVALFVSMSVGWGHRRLPHLAWIGFMVTAAVLAGMLFHRLVERPLLRLVERKRKTATDSQPLPMPARVAA